MVDYVLSKLEEFLALLTYVLQSDMMSTEANGTDSQDADVDAVSDKLKNVMLDGNNYEQRW